VLAAAATAATAAAAVVAEAAEAAAAAETTGAETEKEVDAEAGAKAPTGERIRLLCRLCCKRPTGRRC
jgi:hypothetical protein